MPKLFLDEEAELCRRRALSYIGKPEAPFLLKIAGEFDRLAVEREGCRGRTFGK
jgi:hypothetical protein